MVEMSLLLIVSAKEDEKLEETKWCVFCGTPCSIIVKSLSHNKVIAESFKSSLTHLVNELIHFDFTNPPLVSSTLIWDWHSSAF